MPICVCNCPGSGRSLRSASQNSAAFQCARCWHVRLRQKTRSTPSGEVLSCRQFRSRALRAALLLAGAAAAVAVVALSAQRRRTPSRSAWSPRCPASRPSPARRSRAASRSRSTRSTPRAACSARRSSWSCRDDESNPAKGVVAARELRAAREGRGAVRRPRHAGVARHRAVRQPGQGAVHGRLGGRHADHPQRRQPRTMCSASRRSTRWSTRRWSQYAHEEIRRQEAGHDPDQQSLGRIEREGPEGRARRQEHSRTRRIEKFEANDVDVVPQLTRLKARRRRRAVPGRQRRARRRRW